MHNLYTSGTFSSMSYLSLTRSVPTGVDEVRLVKVSLIDRDDTPVDSCFYVEILFHFNIPFNIYPTHRLL